MARPEVLLLLRPGVITKDPPTFAERREPFAVIRCPACKGAGSVDMDQYEGKVSVECGNCEYHETHDLRETNPCLM